MSDGSRGLYDGRDPETMSDDEILAWHHADAERNREEMRRRALERPDLYDGRISRTKGLMPVIARSERTLPDGSTVVNEPPTWDDDVIWDFRAGGELKPPREWESPERAAHRAHVFEQAAQEQEDAGDRTASGTRATARQIAGRAAQLHAARQVAIEDEAAGRPVVDAATMLREGRVPGLATTDEPTPDGGETPPRPRAGDGEDGPVTDEPNRPRRWWERRP